MERKKEKNRMKIEIEIPEFEGFEYVRSGRAERGDFIIWDIFGNPSIPEQWQSITATYGRYAIYKKKAVPKPRPSEVELKFIPIKSSDEIPGDFENILVTFPDDPTQFSFKRSYVGTFFNASGHTLKAFEQSYGKAIGYIPIAFNTSLCK